MTPIEAIRKARTFDGAKFVAMDNTTGVTSWYAYKNRPYLTDMGRWMGKSDSYDFLAISTCHFVDYKTSLIELSQIKVR